MAHRTSQQMIDDLLSEYPNEGKTSTDDAFLTALGFTDPQVRDQMKAAAAENAYTGPDADEVSSGSSRRRDSSSPSTGYDSAARIAHSTIQTATYSSMM